jgi:diaminopimelate decarboxylase
MKSALPGAEIFYAMKANPNLQVMATLKNAGAKVDVVSRGEIRRALEAGFEPTDIVYSGVGKTEREINEALFLGIYQINVESIPELQRIASLVRAKSTKAAIALRLNPNIDINTHPYIATGLNENKFGMELIQLAEIESLLQLNSDCLSLVGISLHLGSQMMEFSGFREALRILNPIYKNLQAKFPTLQRFDIGGGLGVYYQGQHLRAEEALLAEYAQIVKEETANLNCQLQMEPGRWIVSHAGALLSQVQYVKVTSMKTFLVLDSGMNHLVRPALYEAYHEIYTVKKSSNAKMKVYDIVGPICESADIFAKGRSLPECKEGDFVVIADAGAYGYSMANTYNLQDLPGEICF